MHEIDRHQLRRLPVRRGTREYALALVNRAAAASLRLHDPADTEALHDFRVSIRRLRSFHRAFAEHLPFDRKTIRRLKKLARSTNGPRDVEVGLEWLATQRSGLTSRQRVGYDWMVARLHDEKNEAYRWVRASIPLRWLKLEGRLRNALQEPFSDALGAATFGHVSAERVNAFIDEMERQLGQVRTIEDEAHAHEARICAKRVRYLLDPFKGAVDGVKAVLKSLTAMQDVLGELNDAHVLLDRLREDIRRAAADRATLLFELTTAAESDERAVRSARARDERPGLVEIARRAQRRREALFARALENWLGDGAAALLVEARDVTERLAGDGPLRGRGADEKDSTPGTA